MADIDAGSLMMCIQAVNAEIKRYEALLASEPLNDGPDIQELIFIYETTAQVLKKAYESEWDPSSNLPKYDTFGDVQR